MTQTFKEQLLDYLTGKIDIQTGNNHPTFNAVSIYPVSYTHLTLPTIYTV